MPLYEVFNCAIVRLKKGAAMLVWFLIIVMVLLVIALVYLMRSIQQRRVYDGFEELIEALDAKGHKGLFEIAEDEIIPISYNKLDN